MQPWEWFWPSKAFAQALLSTAIFLPKIQFLSVCLIKYLHEVLSWWAPKGKSWNFRSSDCWKIHFWHSFRRRSLACTSFVCSSSDSYQNFKIFMGSFMRLSFITQFKIEFLVLFTCCRKVLAKMPAFKPFSKLEITSVNIEHQVKSKLAWPISTKVKSIKNTDDTALIYVFKRIK